MRHLIWIIALLVALALVAGVGLFFAIEPALPRLPDDLKLLAAAPATEIYGRNGDLIARLGGRQYISIDRISPHFLHAVVSVEDKRFYRHHGIDRLATLRALAQNIFSFGNAPGGSTITQQLVKNLFFTFERSWKRKALEALAALAIEGRFSKDEILETYCNYIYFGQDAYGVERAAQTFFGRDAARLELHEAALLAALPNSPSRLNPFNHPEAARERQRQVLEALARNGYIQPSEVDSIAALELDFSRGRMRRSQGSFAVDYALELASSQVGSDVVSYGGVRIQTSLDPGLQRIAEAALASGVAELEQRLKPQQGPDSSRLEGALVALDVGTGEVRALVGGRNYRESVFNRAVSARRQPGSAFKPAVYLAALENLDITPASVLEDKPVKFKLERGKTWSPTNFDGRYRGRVTLKLALMKSINTIAAQLIDSVGPAAVVNTAKRLGIATPLQPLLSLSLGAQGLPPLELANAFATLAREGVELEPRMVRRIEGPGGVLLGEYLSAGEARFDPEKVFILLDMMSGVLEEGGTGEVVRRRGFQGAAIGKTGTSSDFRDAWFAGSTPGLTCVVWVGYDDNREMRMETGAGVTGASGAAHIWADFMIQATAGGSGSTFPRPEGIKIAYVAPNEGTLSRTQVEGFIPVALPANQWSQIPTEDEERGHGVVLPHSPNEY